MNIRIHWQKDINLIVDKKKTLLQEEDNIHKKYDLSSYEVYIDTPCSSLRTIV